MAKRTPMTTTGLSAPGSTANAILQTATKPNRQSPQYAVWIEQQDFLEFLRAGRRSEDVVLYAGLTHCFLYGIAVPSSAVTAVDVDDLLGWSCPFSTWGAMARLPGRRIGEAAVDRTAFEQLRIKDA